MNNTFHRIVALVGAVVIMATALPVSVSAASKPESDHPRLFLRAGQEKALKKNIRRDRVWSMMHEAIVEECNVIDTLPTMERILEGPRLHATSCEVLRRVLYLSYAYRIEGDKKYAARAEKEMLAAAAFVDWNPSHYLDVAEMTTALAIGYDWLYDYLPKSSREVLVEAICTKGLEPSYIRKYHYPFMIKESRFANWGQVCHGGLAIGAIAVWDESPEMANEILERSKEYIKLPMSKGYPPEGCYPEGFGYWAFGTQYNILFIDALEQFFGPESVAEYKATEGFVASGDFSQWLITPSLRTFGYSDNSTRIFVEPVAMWFAKQNYDPSLFYMQRELVNKFQKEDKSYVKGIKNRLVPMMVIWGAGTGRRPFVNLEKAETPTRKFYLGRGSNSVCVMRSGWTEDATYVGYKAGRPNNFHGHMDIGSFYIEAGGVRWSFDLGSDHYGDIAKAKVSMFNTKQDSPRWNLLTRYNNMAHSTLTIDSLYQRADQTCYFESFSDKADDMWAESDLTVAYGGSVKSIVRRVGLADDSRVEVKDTLTGGENDAEVVWNMTTEAELESFDAEQGRVVLSAINVRGERKHLEMLISVEGIDSYEVRCEPLVLNNAFETPLAEPVNMLKVVYTMPANGTAAMQVTMQTIEE